MTNRKFAAMTPDLLVRKGEASPSRVVLPFASPLAVSRVRGSDMPNKLTRVRSIAVQDAYKRWRAARDAADGPAAPAADGMGLRKVAQGRT